MIRALIPAAAIGICITACGSSAQVTSHCSAYQNRYRGWSYRVSLHNQTSNSIQVNIISTGFFKSGSEVGSDSQTTIFGSTVIAPDQSLQWVFGAPQNLISGTGQPQFNSCRVLSWQ